ncbi:glycosyltransferase [Alkalicoccus chagannorensis]|uniref:glycosyltransferase n=1 Tax=Alkalicoccus chagannorensis TaxID=427072 RepID=UPI000414CC8B|nr:glycosyltransferase [Alkalicoccus chagannorensis]
MGHVVLAVPHYEELRGNKITADRMQVWLHERGVNTTIISSTLNDEIPDDTSLLHGFHARKFAQYYEDNELDIPYIITITGTDINQDIEDSELGPLTKRCLRHAAFIHVFDEGMKERVRAYVPDREEAIVVQPQSVPIPDYNEPDNTIPQLLLPAGIRSVKNIRGAVTMLDSLAEETSLSLAVVGPVLEEEEGEWLREAAAGRDWLHYLGKAAYEDMGELYANADIVLNTSFSEGQSSAVMEGMAAGRALLVSNISGNRSLVTHEQTGLVYDDSRSFSDSCRRLLEEPALRQRLGLAARDMMKEHYHPAVEAEKLQDLYKKAGV